MTNRLRGSSSLWALAILLAFAVPAFGKSKDKDKGEASMKVGGAEWTAKYAYARYKEDRLKISATWSSYADGKSQRQVLSLSVKGYTGPGTYELNNMNSSFTVVGLDTQALEDKKNDDAATQKLLADVLSESKVLLLKGAKVTITSANDKEVKGTFSSPGMYGQTPITDGVFRAVVKKPKSK